MRFSRILAIALLTGTTTAGAQAASTPHQKAHAKVESQIDLQKEAKMTMADARSMALATVPGSTVRSGEIEREDGRLVYSFDMKVRGKSGIDEVIIDAMTGKLISNQHETPKMERAEAKADAKAAKAAARAGKRKP